MATITAFRVLHRLALSYLNQLSRVTGLHVRHRLRSFSSQSFRVPPFRLYLLPKFHENLPVSI